MKVVGMSIIKSMDYFSQWFDYANEIFDYAVLYVINEKDLKKVEDELKTKNKNWVILSNIENLKDENDYDIRLRLWGKIRNIASEGDWIFSLDSDEIPCMEVKLINQVVPQLSKDIQAISFKRLDMWSINQVRKDGMWSNYYTKMIKFVDKEPILISRPEGNWVKQGEKFYFPINYDDLKMFWNSDMRIRYYGLLTTQQKIDCSKNIDLIGHTDAIMSAHLKTILDTPLLEKYNDDIVLKKVFLAVPIVDINITEQFIKKLFDMCEVYPGPLSLGIFIESDKVNQHEIIDEYIKEHKLDIAIDIFPVKLINIESPAQKEYGIKKAIYDALKDEPGDYDYYAIFDAQHPFDPSILNHMLCLERDIVADMRKNIRYAYCISRKLMKLIEFDKLVASQNEIVSILNFADEKGFLAWGIGRGIPGPLQKSLGRYLKSKMPAFVSSFDQIKADEYIR